MQGQYDDGDTGLYYNTFRYYDADAGRFTAEDPIGIRGGMNLYKYASNPFGWADPLGLADVHYPFDDMYDYEPSDHKAAYGGLGVGASVHFGLIGKSVHVGLKFPQKRLFLYVTYLYNRILCDKKCIHNYIYFPIEIC
jgi:RHS repeat-associated protein